MRLIDADNLREKFKERYMAAVEWKNKTIFREESIKRTRENPEGMLETIRELKKRSPQSPGAVIDAYSDEIAVLKEMGYEI